VRLFGILIDDGLPGRLLKIVIVVWKSLCIVRWNGMSVFLSVVKSVTYQGRTLCAIFNMCIHVMLNTLKSSEYGRHLGRTLVVLIMQMT